MSAKIVASSESAERGQLGADFLVAADGAKTGKWCRIEAIGAANATFTTLTSTTMSGTLANITLVPGQQLRGYFTAITVATGAIIAYKAEA